MPSLICHSPTQSPSETSLLCGVQSSLEYPHPNLLNVYAQEAPIIKAFPDQPSINKRVSLMKKSIMNKRASQVVLEVKSLRANAGDVRDMGSIPR